MIGSRVNSPHKFKRIMIFGRPGSGKSTFAYELAARTGLPLYHLDKYFFVSGWIERDAQEFKQIQEQIIMGERWIIDGNSVRTLEDRWSKADLVLYFNYGRFICLIRLLKRLFSKSIVIDDRASGCPEVMRIRLIKYMWTFENRVRDKINELISKYPATTFIEINSDEDLKLIEAMR